MTKKQIFSVVFIFVGCYFSFSNDFLVTNKRDTVYGKIRLAYFPFSDNGINITTNENNRIFYPFKEVKSYTLNDNKFVVLNFKKKNGTIIYFTACLVVDGKQKLAGQECNLTENNYMIYKNRYTLLNAKNFTTQIWPEMLSCETFASLHQSMSTKYLTRLIRMNRWDAIIAIIEKYNSSC